MLKPTWLLFLCVLIHITAIFAAHTKRGDCDEDKPKKTSTQIIHKPEPTHTSTTIIAVTVTDKVTATHVPSAQPTIPSKNDTASREHCHTCENSCEHSCSDSPCGHTCKDGPCHVVCIYKTPPPKYEPQIVAAGALLMTLGLFMMLMGFPFFIVTMAITGLLLGSSVTWVCLHAAEPPLGYPMPSTFYLACCIGGGLLLAGISLFWWKVTMYLLCGAAGYLLSLYIWTWREDFILQDILARNIIGLALGFIFILGFVLVEFATVILSTSLIGAYAFIFGLDLFVKTGFLIGFKNILDFNRHLTGNHDYIDASTAKPMDEASRFYAHYTINTKVYGMLAAVVGLWMVSSIWQRYYNSGNRFGLRVIKNSNDTLKAKFQKITPKTKYSSTD
ncbi:uncharacterized protein EV154DRAFT_556467 [Mucor mucedo]|uniref:uncharacterized protein n=1 Tax=Mucor mucedo TaxID=29922 RepID=UPI0022210005|nr:uncharacterized protein EV154DRAFT_556467 [Mucor mucedo]KAI7872629.1 hypothetical protein EV154DRAFT_556467 [Mucor mucedo]